MRRVFALVITVGVGLAAACGSSDSNSFICCYDWLGTPGSWSCPNQAAETACCGATPQDEPGCLTSPGTCTMVSSSECP
jgi:hypothetical protein